MKIRKAVGAVIKKDEKYLLVNKTKNSNVKVSLPEEGIWDFVKGGIKKDEGRREALARELYEELGIRRFKIIEELEEPLYFAFSGTQKNDVYEAQITYFFIIEILEDIENIKLDKRELLTWGLFAKEETIQRLTHDESRKYFILILQ